MFPCLKIGILLFFSSFHFSKTEKNSKRILLNDPDVVLHRLDSMDKKIASLQTELINTQTELTNTKTNPTNTKTEISNIQSKLTTTQTDLANEKVKNENLRQMIQNMTSPGSTYVRWGRKTCPGSELVYTGFAAGQSYHQSNLWGGPANSLCLPNDPELSNKSTAGASFLYGSEYQDNVFANGAIDEDVPCCVCIRSNAYAIIMIPGRKTCYSGWNMEYNGLLGSGAYRHRSSSYKCIDASPEFLQAGKDDKDGNLLYSTSTKCGSLPCPRYTDNVAVNCVVCSK